VQVSNEPSTLNALVSVRGNDPNTSRIPLVFMHLPRDSSALLMLAKRGDDVEVITTRRASTWGLALPVLRLAGPFTGRSDGEATPLHIEATIEPQRLGVRAATGADAPGAAAPEGAWYTLALTPLLGWAMIQTVVEVHEWPAPVFALCWLVALWAPVAWWGRRSGEAWWRTWGATVGALCGALALLPRVMPVAGASASEWLMMAAVVAVATFAAGRVARPRTPTPRASGPAPAAAGQRAYDSAAQRGTFPA
jgi:hypothetical protein